MLIDGSYDVIDELSTIIITRKWLLIAITYSLMILIVLKSQKSWVNKGGSYFTYSICYQKMKYDKTRLSPSLESHFVKKTVKKNFRCWGLKKGITFAISFFFFFLFSLTKKSGGLNAFLQKKIQILHHLTCLFQKNFSSKTFRIV